MPAPIADPLGEKGGKKSIWVSAADSRKLEETGLTAGEVFRRGLAATPDPVRVPEGLEHALELVSRTATALANGARLAWPQEQAPYPQASSTCTGDCDHAAGRHVPGPVTVTELRLELSADDDVATAALEGLAEQQRLLLAQYGAGMDDSETLEAAAAITERHGSPVMAAHLRNSARHLRRSAEQQEKQEKQVPLPGKRPFSRIREL